MIALACDHGGYELMQTVREYLDKQGIAYKDFGTDSADSCDYPVIMKPAAEAILAGECDKGIFICGTGIGISVAANKIKGIRAALCANEFMAQMAREHNDANVLVLGGRVVGVELALSIVAKFLIADFSRLEKHARRIKQIADLEQ